MKEGKWRHKKYFEKNIKTIFVLFQERMSLKHKNTGKWAKGQIKYGKYNKEVSYIDNVVFFNL